MRQETFTKLRHEAIQETKDLIQGVLLSFVLDGAEIQKTTRPIIQQSFIIETLSLDKKTVYKKLKELKEKGYFDYKPTYYFKGNSKYSSTQFELKEAATKHLHFKRKEQQETTNIEEQTTPANIAEICARLFEQIQDGERPDNSQFQTLIQDTIKENGLTMTVTEFLEIFKSYVAENKSNNPVAQC